MRNKSKLLVINIFLIPLLALIMGCQVSPQSRPSSSSTHMVSTQRSTPVSSQTLQNQIHTQTQTTPEVIPTRLPKSTIGCKQPASNYERLEVNGHKLNRRTYEMLQYANELYSGPIDITGDAITQGSYTNAVDASFGTHSGGGAVDLSVMSPGTYTVLYDEIEPLINALRLAGFAAWFRDFNELYDGSPVHIHAIAIGDRELSITAREQLAGPFGYFWGYNGLPTDDGMPIRDLHGGPIVCEWMIEKGYPIKTATPSAEEQMP